MFGSKLSKKMQETHEKSGVFPKNRQQNATKELGVFQWIVLVFRFAHELLQQWSRGAELSYTIGRCVHLERWSSHGKWVEHGIANLCSIRAGCIYHGPWCGFLWTAFWETCLWSALRLRNLFLHSKHLVCRWFTSCKLGFVDAIFDRWRVFIRFFDHPLYET